MNKQAQGNLWADAAGITLAFWALIGGAYGFAWVLERVCGY